MLKKMIAYEDFNGVERVEPFYFNLTKAELLRMELKVPGGLAAYIEGIGMSRDGAAVSKWLSDFITWCYGEKSEDGRSFVKSEELTKEFLTSEPYSVLLMQLIDEPNEMAAFFEGVLPSSLIKEQKKAVKKYGSEEAALEALNQERIKRALEGQSDEPAIGERDV